MSQTMYKPVFDRYFFSLLANKMGWKDVDKLYDKGLTIQHIESLSAKLEETEFKVKETVEWQTFKQTINRPFMFCYMRVDELLPLFFTGKRKDNVKIRLLNRLARFISCDIRRQSDLGSNLVYTINTQLKRLSSYEELTRSHHQIHVYERMNHQSNGSALSKTCGSGLMPAVPANSRIIIHERFCQPGDTIFATYLKKGKEKCLKLRKGKNGWNIEEESTTRADRDTYWVFTDLVEGNRLTLRKVGFDESYSYDQLQKVRLIKSTGYQDIVSALPELMRQDYFINLHAGGYFKNALSDLLDTNYQIKLDCLADFRRFELVLKQTDYRAQQLKQRFPELFPYEPGAFCEIGNEGLRNLFGYNGVAYFDEYRERTFRQSSEKSIKINISKLDKLARFLTLESVYPDDKSLLECCQTGQRPYQSSYVDLEKAYASSLLDRFKVNGFGSGVNLSKAGLFSHLVPVGTTICFSYIQYLDVDGKPVRNCVSIYYIGDNCWRVTDKGNSRIDDERTWVALAFFSGEPLRLTTFEGDISYCFGYIEGGIHIEHGSNRSREGIGTFTQCNVLRMGELMGSPVKPSKKKRE